LLEGLGEMFSVAVQIVHEQKAGDGVDHDVFLVSWNDLPTS
jgi:predicted RecA/RadA family phage recombinase